MAALADKVILVTGATDGIGKGTAGELAAMGARILLHGRRAERVTQAKHDLGRIAPDARIDPFVADFSALAQVRELADAVIRRTDHLDILINNAGIGAGPSGAQRREQSADGHELRFAVNHLAPFLLTHLLLPLLAQGMPARVVNVASAAQRPIDFDNVMLERDYDGFRAYAQSKLAMVMATFEFARCLEEQAITVNAVHPGSLLDTKMVREGFGTPQGPVEQGIASEVFVATSPDLVDVTGTYFDELRPAKAHPQAYDADARRRLWRLSEQLTGLTGRSSG
ncbi:MAG: SDR family NAD(P)-dependent oxidoreductase [Rhodospirillales bacterium]|nr:MAG: SDR family NAD(P)-dependent oxidoreductase [Rhodospirillales bacterium]